MDKRYRTIQQRALNLPHYGAEQELSCLLRECLREEEFVSGDRFLSDRELIELVGKSRSVVRRSIDRLREEGWLERRPGLGTFVAKTASEIETMCGGIKSPFAGGTRSSCKMKRFGIFGHGQTTWSQKDWCMEFFNAMSESIVEDPIVMDYIGWNESNSIQVLKSLHYNPPDVIFFLGPGQDHYRVIAKSEELGIPCILVGVRNPEYGIPCIYEESETSGQDVVSYILARGHHQFAFLEMTSICSWWAFDRYDAITKAWYNQKASQDEMHTFWFPTSCGGTKILHEYMDIFITFLKEKKPTVLLFGSCMLAMALLEVINLYEIKLPKQYSFIIWDSDPNINMLYYPLIPTIVPLPLRKMGIKAAELGKKILRHESVPLENVIPGRKILEGDTVVKL